MLVVIRLLAATGGPEAGHSLRCDTLHGRCFFPARPRSDGDSTVPPTRVEASQVTHAYSLMRAALPAVGGLAT